MKPDYQFLDCQSEHGFEPVDPDSERVTFWVDEHGETHGQPRRWHAVRAFALALAEAGLLWVVVLGIIALFYAVFG